ncbi:MAG: leucine-rich repeat protein [Clostridia bacterium]|nr:leucine-rich repeat protein [Clostridia bacterium]
MKVRYFAAILFVLLVILSIPAAGRTESALSEGDFEYTVSGGCAVISAYKGTNTDVTVPAALGGYPVKALGQVFKNNASITSVILPDGLETIDTYAFYQCTSLASAYIPDSVTSIGNYVFSGCSSLTDVQLSKNITAIPEDMFRQCTSLVSLTVPEGVTSIERYAFYNCKSLSDLSLPSTLEKIEYYAFFQNTALGEIMLGDNVSSINTGNLNYSENAYFSCTANTSTETALRNAYMPFKLNSLPDYVLREQRNSETNTRYTQVYKYIGAGGDIVLPDCASEIALSAFAENDTITSVVIPESITRIRSSAFCKCANIASIEIQGDLDSIDSHALSYLTSLTEMTFKGSVKEIGNRAFIHCTLLENVNLPAGGEKISEYAFSECYSLKSITIGEGVTEIGGYAFYLCESLTDVALPDSLTTLNAYAFYTCNLLTEIYLPDNLTTVGRNAAQNNDSVAVLYYNPGTLTETAVLESNYSHYASTGSKEFVFYNSLNTTTLGLVKELRYYRGTDSVVSVPDGTQILYNNLFRNNTSLTSVALPDTITGIRNSAFYGCTSLTEILLPDSVTEIGSSVFYGCTALTKVNIPSAVTVIAGNTFYKCENLKYVCLPDNITSVATNSVSPAYTTLLINRGTVTEQTFLTANAHFAYEDDPDFVFQSKYVDDVQILTLARYNGTDADVVIPSGTTAIGNGVFNNMAFLTSVTVPDTVTQIGYVNFTRCENLPIVYLPDEIISIGYEVGSNESQTKLAVNRGSETENTLKEEYKIFVYADSAEYLLYYQPEDGSGEDGSGERELALIAYLGTASDIHVPDGVQVINAQCFQDNEVITSVSMPDTVVKIGGNAFYDCVNLASVEFSENLTSLGSYAFRNTALTTVALPAGFETLNTYAFYMCGELETVILPDSLTAIPDYAFANCKNLKEIRFPSSLVSIGKYAFVETAFTDICLPDSVRTLGEYVFKNNRALLNITLPDGITEIPKGAFYDCIALTEVHVPINVTAIGNEAFYTCDNLKFVWLSDNIISLGSNAASTAYTAFVINRDTVTQQTIAGTGMYFVYANEPEFVFCSLYEEELNRLMLVRYDGTDADVVIPDGTAVIGEKIFYNMAFLTSVTVPDSVTEIRNMNFYECANLPCVYLPDNITSIGYSVGFFKEEGTYLVINRESATESALKNIGMHFTYSGHEEYLLSYDDEDGLMLIDYTTPLTVAVIPEGVQTIAGCYEMDMVITSVIMPDSVQKIRAGAFGGCSNLSSVTFSQNLVFIGDSAFRNTALERIELPGSLVFLESAAFYGNEKLETVILPDSLTAIPDYAFAYCDNLREVNFPSGLVSIGDRAFISASLSRIDLPDSVTTIGSYAFKDNEGINTLVLPDGITEIYEGAFEGCGWLYDVTLPENLVSVGERAFFCTHLTNITLPSTVTYIGEDAFSSTWLPSITIPSGVTSILHPIANDGAMTNVVLPPSVTEISDDAFQPNVSLVYCYKGSYAEGWAKDTGRFVIYLGDADLSDYLGIHCYDQPWNPPEMEVGKTFIWGGEVWAYPIPEGMKVSFSCVSSNPDVIEVENEYMHLRSAGEAVLTVTMNERPDLSLTWTIEVRKPVIDFEVPAYVFTPVGETVKIEVENVVPTGANPEYYWEYYYDNCSYMGSLDLRTASGAYIYNMDKGMYQVQIGAYSGIKKYVGVMVYESMSAPQVYAMPDALNAGETSKANVRVTVDGIPFIGEGALFSLSSSDESVVSITEKNELYACKAGTAVITVYDLSGNTAGTISVTVNSSAVVLLPYGLTTVNEEAFAYSGIQKVVLPETCTSIMNAAFANCEKLTLIEIPESVNFIAENAFDGSDNAVFNTPAGSYAAQYAAEHEIAIQ